MAVSQVYQFNPSAEKDDAAPLMTGSRLKLCQALEKNYYEVSLMLPTLASEQAKICDGLRALGITHSKVRDDRNLRSMYTLLHTIPKTLLQSVIQNTFGYDFNKTFIQKEKPDVYEASGSGVYVVGQSIRGRQGKWLNATEILILCETQIPRYIAAYEQWKIHDGDRTKMTGQQKAEDTWLRQVDSAFGSRVKNLADRPRFVQSDERCDRLRQYAKSLKRRCNRADKLNYHVQAPMQVGCGNDIADRMSAHLPKHGLQSSSYIWGLTLCLIKTMNKIPEVVVQPLALTFSNDQLQVAEVLGTLLAGSLVMQDGCNVMGPGTQSGTVEEEKLIMSKKQVCVTKQFFTTNVKETLAEIDRRKAFIDTVDVMKASPSVTIQHVLRDWKAKIIELGVLTKQLEAKKANARVIENETAARKKAAQEKYARLGDFHHLFNVLLAPYQQPELFPDYHNGMRTIPQSSPVDMAPEVNPQRRDDESSQVVRQSPADLLMQRDTRSRSIPDSQESVDDHSSRSSEEL